MTSRVLGGAAIALVVLTTGCGSLRTKEYTVQVEGHVVDAKAIDTRPCVLEGLEKWEALARRQQQGMTAYDFSMATIRDATVTITFSLDRNGVVETTGKSLVEGEEGFSLRYPSRTYEDRETIADSRNARFKFQASGKSPEGRLVAVTVSAEAPGFVPVERTFEADETTFVKGLFNVTIFPLVAMKRASPAASR